MKISGAQITAARDLLKITQAELAEAAEVATQTVRRFEADEAIPQRANLEKILAELGRRGIEFTSGDSPPTAGDGIGVWLNYAKAAEFARSAGQTRSNVDK